MSALFTPNAERREYLGEPTLAQVMRRPRWIAALLLALAVAAGFAWLGRWQLDMAVRDDSQQVADTEKPRELLSVAVPGRGLTEDAAGSVVTVRGTVDSANYAVVQNRENDGRIGAWVVARLLVSDGEDASGGAAKSETSNIPLAIGWAENVREAKRAAEKLGALGAQEVNLRGRLMPTEETRVPHPEEDPHALLSMSPAQLINVWQGVRGTSYQGYIVLHEVTTGKNLRTVAGLAEIPSPAPEPPETINWLNLFYAIEWVVFALFAVFFWFRLTRDAWEKEHELQELEKAAAGAEVVQQRQGQTAGAASTADGVRAEASRDAAGDTQALPR